MSLETEMIQTTLADAYAFACTKQAGENASYIPYLASVPSDLCGFAVVTAAGDVFQVGDADFEFAIESISKVFTLCNVIDGIGADALQQKVGADPTGLPFNSVMALELHSGKPLSPLVNAGAISTASLVAGDGPEARWQSILATQSAFAGRSIQLSDEVNESEQTTNFHNRAIAWLMYSAEACYSDPMEAVDVYTRQCSTLVNAVDLATMGACLANGGINPRTQQQVLAEANVHPVLAEMMMEGLYDASGDFAFEVGLPGKSGVGGGVLAVVPGQLAIAGFAPPLDEVGNSVRARAGISYFAKELGLNLFTP